NLSLKLRILPTLREADGLTMSSRNSYLQSHERAAATVLYKALQAGQRAFGQGQAQSLRREYPYPLFPVRQAMIDAIAHEPLAQLEYAEIRDPVSFLPLGTLQAPAVLLLAVRIGSTRLIDNFVLDSDGRWDTGVFVREEEHAQQSDSSSHSRTQERVTHHYG